MSAGGAQSNEDEDEEQEKEEEKIIFAVQLASYEPNVKVKIIKEIRKMTDLTLKDVRSFGCDLIPLCCDAFCLRVGCQNCLFCARR